MYEYLDMVEGSKEPKVNGGKFMFVRLFERSDGHVRTIRSYPPLLQPLRKYLLNLAVVALILAA